MDYCLPDVVRRTLLRGSQDKAQKQRGLLRLYEDMNRLDGEG